MDYLRCKRTVYHRMGQVNKNALESDLHVANNSYSRFITSFSMPSIALSNSASDAFFQTSEARICTAMNCTMS